MRETQFTLIGNLENRRAAFFREACVHLGFAPPIEISWESILQGGASAKNPLRHVTGTVRIESPGENFKVERQLIALGYQADDPNAIPRDVALNMQEDRGRLRCQQQWYRGWKTTLQNLADSLPEAEFLNHPENIAVLFDKWHCQKKLSESGIPIPRQIGRISSFDDLQEKMKTTGVRRVFVKPRHGSSASGIVALETNPKGQIQATTPVVIQDGIRLYNSLKLQHYKTEREIRSLIDLLAKENLMAEQWFPKASVGGKVFDLRVLMIAGKCKHTVARTSRSPITNLHLGNERGDLIQILERIGCSKWEEAKSICEQAALLFPRCHYLAIDLMIGSNFNQIAIAEINAFGDLLPGIFVDDLDSYASQIESFP